MDNNESQKWIFGVDENSDSVFNERFLVCPKCKEPLHQMDIEVYYRCPFCDYAFPQDAAMEDFVIDRVVQGWVRRQGVSPTAVKDNQFPSF